MDFLMKAFNSFLGLFEKMGLEHVATIIVVSFILYVFVTLFQILKSFSFHMVKEIKFSRNKDHEVEKTVTEEIELGPEDCSCSGESVILSNVVSEDLDEEYLTPLARGNSITIDMPSEEDFVTESYFNYQLNKLKKEITGNFTASVNYDIEFESLKREIALFNVKVNKLEAKFEELEIKASRVFDVKTDYYKEYNKTREMAEATRNNLAHHLKSYSQEFSVFKNDVDTRFFTISSRQGALSQTLLELMKKDVPSGETVKHRTDVFVNCKNMPKKTVKDVERKMMQQGVCSLSDEEFSSIINEGENTIVSHLSELWHDDLHKTTKTNKSVLGKVYETSPNKIIEEVVDIKAVIKNAQEESGKEEPSAEDIKKAFLKWWNAKGECSVTDVKSESKLLRPHNLDKKKHTSTWYRLPKIGRETKEEGELIYTSVLNPGTKDNLTVHGYKKSRLPCLLRERDDWSFLAIYCNDELLTFYKYNFHKRGSEFFAFTEPSRTVRCYKSQRGINAAMSVLGIDWVDNIDLDIK